MGEFRRTYQHNVIFDSTAPQSLAIAVAHGVDASTEDRTLVGEHHRVSARMPVNVSKRNFDASGEYASQYWFDSEPGTRVDHFV